MHREVSTVAVILSLLMAGAGGALAQSPAPVPEASGAKSIEARIADLEAQIVALKAEVAQFKEGDSKTTPTPSTTGKDYPTGDVGGYVQMDWEQHFGPGAGISGLVPRRVRLEYVGKIASDVDYKVSVEGASAAADLVRDAYVKYKGSGGKHTWTVGQFKMPQGYADLLPDTNQLLGTRPIMMEAATWNGTRFTAIAPSRQLGVQYAYTDSHNLAQAAIFGGNGRNTMDENSAKDVAVRYIHSSKDKRHELGGSVRVGQEFAGAAAANLTNIGLEYRYHGKKWQVLAEGLTGSVRTANNTLRPQAGVCLDLVYWPNGTKRYAWWPEAGAGDEYWMARLERVWRDQTFTNSVTVAWLGYGRYVRDNWRFTIALGVQRQEQKLILSNTVRF